MENVSLLNLIFLRIIKVYKQGGILYESPDLRKKHYSNSFIEEEEIEEEFDDTDNELVRTKSLVPDTMELDEAIMRMEMLNHSFFIYRDDETKEIAVVYKRHDGGYGLIETE